MKTIFDVLDYVYKIVNVSGVTTTIDGKVYRNSRPLDSITRDIVVLALPITGGNDIDIQECVIVINCFAKDLAPGRPDEAHLDPTTAAVFTAIEGYSSSTVYLYPEINSQGIMADIDQVGISYSSIRVNCAIQYLTV